MKEKILIFIVGLLLGAIISTASIYFYTVANKSNNDNREIGMKGGNRPDMPNEMNENRPDINNFQNSNQENTN